MADPRPIGDRLSLHVVAYLGILVAITSLAPLDASLGTDDGAYGGQVFALQQGRWDLDRPVPVVDQANEGWFNAAIDPDGPLPYTSNPSYALLLTGGANLWAMATGTTPGEGTAGDNGPALQAIPVLGAVAAAIAGWVVTAHLDRRAARLGFWLVALGPVVVNATSLWAHTLSTALAGVAVLCVVRIVGAPDDRTARPTGWNRVPVAPGIGLAAALAAGAAIRTEAVLWIASLAVATVAVDRRSSTMIVLAPATALGMGAWAANRLWGLSLRADRLPIVTSANELNGSPGWAASRLPAAWELLVTTIRPGPGPVLLLVALMVITLGALDLRSRHAEEEPGAVGAAEPSAPGRSASLGRPAILLLLGVGIYLVVIAVSRSSLLAGTLTAWPAVLVLLVAGRYGCWPVSSSPTSSGAGPPGSRMVAVLLLGSSALFAAAVVATQYAEGGGLQWGGRYLSMAYVPIAAAAAVVGREVFHRTKLPVAALVIAPAVLGVAGSIQLHRGHADLMAAITERPSEVIVSDLRPLTRIGWSALPTAIYVADDTSIEPLLTTLADADVATVTVVGIGDVELDGLAGYHLDGTDGPLRYLVAPALSDGAGAEPPPATAFRPSPEAPDEGP